MRLRHLAQRIGLPAEELPDIEIEGLATLKDADSRHLSFLDNPKYLSDLAQTRAAAVLVAPAHAEVVPSSAVALVHEEPYLKLAEASALFAPDPMRTSGAEPRIGEGCRIAEGVAMGRDVVIEEDVTIMPGCYIGDDVTVGAGSLIHPNVTIYHGTRIGARCIIHAGTVIGSDGYGFAHTREGRHVKLHQLGRVVIEEDVEIGANCAVDRATLGETRIAAGTKIDNLVHIAHNCVLGENCLITGQVGLSGSTRLGRNVVMGGQSGTAGHLEIGDFATIAARGGVTKSLPGGKVYAGFPIMEHKKWLRLNAMLSRMVESFLSKTKKEK